MTTVLQAQSEQHVNSVVIKEKKGQKNTKRWEREIGKGGKGAAKTRGFLKSYMEYYTAILH